MQLDDLINGNRGRGHFPVLPAVLGQHQGSLALDYFLFEEGHFAAHAVVLRLVQLPRSFNLLACSLSFRNWSAVRPLASRNSSDISVGCSWIILGKSSGTRPASAIHSSAFSSKSSAMRFTRSAVGGWTFPCSTCERYVGLTPTASANLRRLNPFSKRLSRSKRPNESCFAGMCYCSLDGK